MAAAGSRRHGTLGSVRLLLVALAGPALRALLDLPFERVVISHGEPVHDRAAYERALALQAWRR